MYDAYMNTTLTRLSVNLTPRADAALELAVQLTGDSKTDTVNRALQFYAWMEHGKSEGKSFYIKDENGNMSRIEIF
jgi:hypothetical protein